MKRKTFEQIFQSVLIHLFKSLCMNFAGPDVTTVRIGPPFLLCNYKGTHMDTH